jgi:hypothetical protein
MNKNNIKCKESWCSTPTRTCGYCAKHYTQYLRYGRTFRYTKADFNEVIDKGTYYELVVIDRAYEEKGRIKIDKEDLATVKLVGRWSLDKDGYAVNSKNGTVKMHRILLKAKSNEEVDHKKPENKADNRRNNIRIANRSQNNSNKVMHPNNTSGYKGVSWSKGMKKWVVQVNANKVRNIIGYFNDPEEGYKAYCKAAKKLHGEFRT